MTLAVGGFITVEGIEGAGKTTQARMLIAALHNAGIPVQLTREPGGSARGELIRRLFIEHEWDGVAEAFLLMAGRRDHVINLIRPKLASGTWVVCDRFSLTTFAYQGYGRGVSLDLLRQMDCLATDSVWHDEADIISDLSIVLDLPAEVGLARARSRSAPDRMERLSVDFFKNTRRGFLALAKHYKCPVVDATGTADEAHDRIKAVVLDRLGVRL